MTVEHQVDLRCLDFNDTAPRRPSYHTRMVNTAQPRSWDQFCGAVGVTSPGLLEWTERLYSLWNLYTKSVSPSNMAASRRTCALLCELAEAMIEHSASGVPTVLDLGSGLSTASLRTCGVVKLTSVDTSAEWLGKTAEFLAANGLPTDNMHQWLAFLGAWRNKSAAASSDETDEAGLTRYDLVFYDLGSISERGKFLRDALDMGNVVILDDVHHYEQVVREVLGCPPYHEHQVYDLRTATLDDYGRYAWAVVRP